MTTAEQLRREGEREGKREGKREGRIEGKQEEKLEVVKNALRLNMDIEQISQLTGLSVDEIEKIKQKSKTQILLSCFQTYTAKRKQNPDVTITIRVSSLKHMF